MAVPQDQQQMKGSRQTRGSSADASTAEEASEINEFRRFLEDQHDRQVHHGHHQAQTTKSPEVVDEVDLDVGKAGSGHTVSPLTSIKNAAEAASIAAWHAVFGSGPPQAAAPEVESFDVASKAGGDFISFLKKGAQSIFGSSSDASRDGRLQGRRGSPVDEAAETADDKASQAPGRSEGKAGVAVEQFEEREEKEVQEEDEQLRLQEEPLQQNLQQEQQKEEEEEKKEKEEKEEEAAETEELLQGSSPSGESNSTQVVNKLPPLPTAPGMQEANFTVGTKVPLHKCVTKQGKQGVDLLMALPEGRILEIMCSAGWDVQPVDEENGLFDIFLPPVKYQVPGASVRIPPPHFKAVVTDLSRPSPAGHVERLSGDLILQNGKDILTVELVLPFSKPFSISASGWTRAFIGSQDGAICVECQVEIGMQLPKVPGLVQVMEFFVKSYATDSVKQIAGSLAFGADRLFEEQSSEEEAE